MNSSIAETQYQSSKWYNIIKECTSSNTGVIQWLNEHKILKDQYYYWKRKLKDMCLESMEQSAFVELTEIQPALPRSVEPEESCASPCALLKFKDISVEIYDTASQEFISRLIKAMTYAE